MWTRIAPESRHATVAAVQRSRRVVAHHVRVVEARRPRTPVRVHARPAVPAVALVARARVLPWTLVVARSVAVAVVGLLCVTVEDLRAVDPVVERVPVLTRTAVRVRPRVRAHPVLRARVRDAVVHV